MYAFVVVVITPRLLRFRPVLIIQILKITKKLIQRVSNFNARGCQERNIAFLSESCANFAQFSLFLQLINNGVHVQGPYLI